MEATQVRPYPDGWRDRRAACAAHRCARIGVRQPVTERSRPSSPWR